MYYVLCLVCKAGFGRFHPFEPCRKCEVGTYNDESPRERDGPGGMHPGPEYQMCTSCPKGYTTAQPGATSVKNCTGEK